MMLVDVINEYLKDNHKKWYAYRGSNVHDAIIIKCNDDATVNVVVDITLQTIYVYTGSVLVEFDYNDFDILDRLSVAMEAIN